MRVTSRSGSRCAAWSDGVDGEIIFGDEVGDDRLAVADRLAIVDNVGKLPARSGRRVEDVLVGNGTPASLRKAKTFSP